MTQTATRSNETPAFAGLGEDAALIAGPATWTDGTPEGTLHMAVLRSPLAHATVRGVDAEQARALPGVVAVLTGEDVADELWPVEIPAHPRLAKGEVDHVGDGVVVVLATDPHTAQEALGLVEVDYEALPAVVDVPGELGAAALP
jgi:carbon-monoxide dehydrogenase large subunit